MNSEKTPVAILTEILDYLCRELTYVEKKEFPPRSIVLMGRAAKTLGEMVEILERREMSDD